MRVAVLGGGYAGVLVTARLEERLPDDTQLILVDDTGDHVVKHELHRLIRRPALADHVTVPLAELTDRATVREAAVETLRPDQRSLQLDDGTAFAYDAAAVCLGGRPAYGGVPGAAEHAFGLTDVDDAAAIRSALDDLIASGAGTATVVGGDLTGVQLAGELAAAVADADAADAIDVVLLEAGETLVPNANFQLQRSLRHRLADVGVDVRTETAVDEVTATTVELADGDSLPNDLLAWTAGVRGPAVFGGDRPDVPATLELADRTFAAGDAVSVTDAQDRDVPPTALGAVEAAPTVAANVEAALAADPGEPPSLREFSFDPPAWAVSVGDGAVASPGQSVLAGEAARAVREAFGSRYLARAGAPERALALFGAEFYQS